MMLLPQTQTEKPKCGGDAREQLELNKKRRKRKSFARISAAFAQLAKLAQIK